jgi:hypothetical protein
MTSQINWKNQNIVIWMLILFNLSDFLEYDPDEFIEYEPNDPKKKDKKKKKNIPNNVVYQSYTIGVDTRKRGASGYYQENMNYLDEDSLQYQLWSSACDLFDSHYTFTVAFNNDAWHWLDDDSDEAWESRHQDKDEEMIVLEDKILDLCRNIRTRSVVTEEINYSSVIKFISNDYRDIDWYDYDSWDQACKKLLENLELYFQALGTNLYLDAYYEFMHKLIGHKQHFDWRLNPILRDLFFGFIFYNPILVSNNGEIIKKDPLNIINFLIKNTKKNIFSNLKESLPKEPKEKIDLDAESLIENHFELFNGGFDSYESFEKSIRKSFDS